MVQNNRGLINLLPGEVVQYSGPASAAKVKNRAVGRVSNYSGVSVRVAKGVSVSTGGGTSSIVYGDTLIESKGSLIVTNRRTVLIAMNYGFEIYHENLSSTAMMSSPDGFIITSGSQTHIVVTKNAPRIVDEIWNNAEPRINEVNRQYLLKEQRLLEQKKQQEIVNQNKAAVRDYNLQNSSKNECLKFACRVHNKDYYVKKRAEIQSKQYQRESFDSTFEAPQKDSIIRELEKQAKKEINGIFFWDVNKRREEFVAENSIRIYEEKLDQWNKAKSAFEKEEDEREKAFYQSVSEELTRYDRLVSGEKEIMLDSIESALDKVGLFYPFHASILSISIQSAYIDLDLPEIEMLPKNVAAMDKDGGVIYHDINQKDIRSRYVNMVFEYAVVIASVVFQSAPSLDDVTISGHTKRRDTDGRQKEEYVYSVIFKRTEMAKANLSKIDAYNFCSLQCENICYLLSNGLLKEIVPFKIPADESEICKSKNNCALYELQDVDSIKENTEDNKETELNQKQPPERNLSTVVPAEAAAPIQNTITEVKERNALSPIRINPVPYVFADITSIITSSSDYVSTSFKQQIVNKALEISKSEAPLHHDVLIKKLLKAFSVNMSNAALDATEKAIKAAGIKTSRYKGEVYCWLPEQDPKEYYGLRFSNERPADEISPQEIKNAIIYTLQTKGSMDKDDLIKATSVTLGYKRLGNNVVSAITVGLQYTKSLGAIIYDSEDKLYKLP